MNEVLILLREQFVQDALKAALLAGMLCSFLGVFVVLKRVVFVGAALAEVASLGGALAFSTPVVVLFERLVAEGPQREHLHHFLPLILALFAMLLAVAFFSIAGGSRRLPREAIIGAVFVGAIGLTVLVLSKVPAGDQHTLDVLQGNILGVPPEELQELFWTCIVVGLIQIFFHKEFVFVSFDPEVARTLGYRAAGWELLWYISLGVMIAVATHVAGTVLVFAYLVLPAVTALMLSRRLNVVFLLAVLTSIIASIGGVLISVSPIDTPTSPSIVACLAALVVLAWSLRGVWNLIVGRLAPSPAKS